MRQLDQDFVGLNVDGKFFAQIEAGLDQVSSMQLDPFGAPGPGMQHLVFDLDATRQHSQFGDSGRLFEIDPIVHRHPRLEMCEFNESVAGLATKPFQFRHALAKCPSRPGFQPVKNEGSKEREKKDE